MWNTTHLYRQKCYYWQGDIMKYAIVIDDKPIKPYGNTAHVYVPKRFLGKRASILIHLDEDEENKSEDEK